MIKYSISPTNEKFKIPDDHESREEVKIVKRICEREKEKRKTIIAVQGLGFVGTVMSAVIADSEINGKESYFVLGVDLPTIDTFWKIPILNKGFCPFKTSDPEVERIIDRVVNSKRNFRATWVKEVYHEAEIIVVDINLDVIKTKIGNAENSEVEIDKFEQAIEDIGKRMKPEALILIETTVPPGTVEHIVKPIIERCFLNRGIAISEKRPLIAHSYERVMPGDKYVESIKKMRRTFSAINLDSTLKTQNFLSSIIDTKQYPLWKLPRPNASEVAKVLENSYRAMNIAFILEWTQLAEDIGINLFEVINSIRVRKGTHDNMMYPGFGVGGYCLTKDTLLAEWASKNIFKRQKHLNLSIQAININDLMPRHTFNLLMKGLDNSIEGKKVAILGASYRKDVDDTRNSPTIMLYDDIKSIGGVPVIHDPFAQIMAQRKDIEIDSDINRVLRDAFAVILVVNHEEYKRLSVEIIINNIKDKGCVIDAFDILTDEKIIKLKNHNLIVLGVGKGHIKYL